MSIISVNNIVTVLKEKYPNHVIMFDCDKGDDPHEPRFHKFILVDEIINYFNKNYTSPFVIEIDNDIGDRYTKDNSIITIDDNDDSFNVTYFKNNYTYYKIYDKKAYLEVKEALIKNSITYNKFLAKYES